MFITVFTSAKPLQLQVLHAVDVSKQPELEDQLLLALRSCLILGFRSFPQNLSTVSSICMPS